MDLRADYGIPANVEGVVITGMEPESEAAEKGLIEGDVIVEINQQAITSPDEIIDVIDKAKANGRSSILLLVNRQGDVQFVALKIDGE